MIKVEIVDTNVQELSGTSKAGKAYNMTLQAAYLDTGDVYPEKFEVILPRPENKDDKVRPYVKGIYTIDFSKSLTVFNGRLNLNPVLIPWAKDGKTI